MRYYEIIGVNCHSPGNPSSYYGSFEPVPGQSDVYTALMKEFGEPGGDLRDWLGDDELHEELLTTTAAECVFDCDDTTFHVVIDLEDIWSHDGKDELETAWDEHFSTVTEQNPVLIAKMLPTVLGLLHDAFVAGYRARDK